MLQDTFCKIFQNFRKILNADHFECILQNFLVCIFYQGRFLIYCFFCFFFSGIICPFTKKNICFLAFFSILVIMQLSLKFPVKTKTFSVADLSRLNCFHNFLERLHSREIFFHLTQLMIRYKQKLHFFLTLQTSEASSFNPAFSD